MGKVTVDKSATYVKEIVDVATGEILEEHREESHDTQTIIPAEPPFVKVYLQDIMYMCDMPRAYTELTYCLLKRASYANAEEGLCVTLAQFTKTKILKECKWEKMQTLNNALNKLVKGGILKRLGTGVYQFNPHLFGRGEWKDISKIRLSWDYDFIAQHKTFASAITYVPGTDPEPVPESVSNTDNPFTSVPELITEPEPDTTESVPDPVVPKRNRKKKMEEKTIEPVSEPNPEVAPKPKRSRKKKQLEETA